jgi:PhnB protein
MLAVPDAPTAAGWYKCALGATELWNLGSVVCLEVEGAPSFLAQPANNGWASPTEIGITTVRVEVFVDDPDTFVERAIEAGADGSLDRAWDHEALWGSTGRAASTIRSGTFGSSATGSPLSPFPW